MDSKDIPALSTWQSCVVDVSLNIYEVSDKIPFVYSMTGEEGCTNSTGYLVLRVYVIWRTDERVKAAKNIKVQILESSQYR